MRKTTSHTLTPGQAQYVVGRLLSDRRISTEDIAGLLGELQSEIEQLERRLESLRGSASAASGSVSSAAPAASQDSGSSAPAAEAPVRRRRGRGRKAAAPAAEAVAIAAPERPRRVKSSQTAASQKLQGLYLSLIKQIPERRRGKIKSIAKAQGREEAIRTMKELLGR